MSLTTRSGSWPALSVGLLATMIISGLIVVGRITGPAMLLGALIYLGGGALIARHWPRQLGAANRVTLIRLVGTSVVAGLLVASAWSGGVGAAPPTPIPMIMVVIGTACLILDGVDGHLARSRGLVSSFGARFDMETDAALLMVLSLAVPIFGVAGWWVLAIGLMRYLYVAAAWVLPWLRIPLLFSQARKVVAVIQGIALLAALTISLLPGLPPWLPTVPLAVALAALCWSFGRDMVWQWHRRSR